MQQYLIIIIKIKASYNQNNNKKKSSFSTVSERRNIQIKTMKKYQIERRV
jgi:hypothetical protein